MACHNATPTLELSLSFYPYRMFHSDGQLVHVNLLHCIQVSSAHRHFYRSDRHHHAETLGAASIVFCDLFSLVHSPFRYMSLYHATKTDLVISCKCLPSNDIAKKKHAAFVEMMFFLNRHIRVSVSLHWLSSLFRVSLVVVVKAALRFLSFVFGMLYLSGSVGYSETFNIFSYRSFNNALASLNKVFVTSLFCQRIDRTFLDRIQERITSGSEHTWFRRW